MTALLAALMLGVAGSAHCLLMCGPLTLAVRSALSGGGSRVLLYHGGRIATYVAIGSVAGVLGQTTTTGGWGQALSIVAGLLLIVVAVSKYRPRGLLKRIDLTHPLAAAGAWTHRRLRTHPRSASVAAGTLNGLLPCGLVYVAVVAAAGSSGSPAEGAAFMLVFGAGTLPALAAVWLSAPALSMRVRSRFGMFGPVAIAIVGLMLVTRGLGVPHPHPEHPASHMR